MAEELASEHLEHAEHAEHAAHEGGLLLKVTSTIAVMAVGAAIIASLESIETSATNGARNLAVLKQSQASNQWAYYQAKSVKQKIYDIASAQGGAKADDFAREAKRYDDETKEIEKTARELEHARDESLEAAEHHEHREHVLTIGATFAHVGIAVATGALILKQRWPWYLAMLLGVVGVATTVYALSSGH